MGTTPKHRWKFFRAGGVDQVALRNGADAVQLGSLDQKLWVALAMPVAGVHLDAKTLAHLDSDKDGRVRAPEIVGAVEWMRDVLKNPDDMMKGGDSVALAALKDGPVLAAAKRILVNLGKGDAAAITLADVADTAKIFHNMRLNGDGIIPADVSDDPELRQLIDDIRGTHGELPDRSGKPGIDQARIDAFCDEAKALVDWRARAVGDPALLPLGEATAPAAEAVAAVRAKVDDYFTRCRMAAFDARAQVALAGSDAELAALSAELLSADSASLARLPLARIDAAGVLPLHDGVNPAWAAPLGKLAAVLPALLGKKQTPAQLAEADWLAVRDKLAAWTAWMADKPRTAVEKLDAARLAKLVATDARGKLTALVKDDLALAGENDAIVSVERLIVLHRDLWRVLHNFVNFADFYGRRGATFQAGTLYLDGRSCNLCVTVSDATKHAALATLAASYLAYCDCTRPGGEKMTIVAAFTAGDAEQLLVGRNGVFYDRQGRDWDATISKVISNPISVREAFWAPYKKLVRLIEDQVGKRAAAADAEAHAKLAVAATATAHVDKTIPPTAPKKIDLGTVAAIGVAVGGIGAMLTGIASAVFGLGWWMPLGLVGLMLMVSGPAMLLAYLKLRQRNLGPILDANGWAINGRARINVPFGAALTDHAVLPPGSERSLHDPFADKKRPWWLYITFAVVLAAAASWYFGKLDVYLPEAARSTTVLGSHAPATNPPPPPPGSADAAKK